MSDVVLRWFHLEPGWSSIFERFESWKQLEPSVWTDGHAVVKLAPRLEIDQPQFAFGVFGSKAWNRLKTGLGVPVLNEDSGSLVVKGPSGLAVRFDLLPSVARPIDDVPDLIMNHISLNVTDLNLECDWYERILGSSVVLARDEVWEPISRSFVKDVHLFRSPDYYVTLRERETNSVDHIGWMTSTTEGVKQIAGAVKSLRWDIVFGPAEIDGCFLFHFRGPDGRVHDFFCPLDELQRRGLVNK